MANNAAQEKSATFATFSAKERFQPIHGATDGVNSGKDSRVKVTVPPLSAVVYEAKGKLAKSKAAPAVEVGGVVVAAAGVGVAGVGAGERRAGERRALRAHDHRRSRHRRRPGR